MTLYAIWTVQNFHHQKALAIYIITWMSWYAVYLGIKTLFLHKSLSLFFVIIPWNELRQVQSYLPRITRKMMMPLSIIRNERKSTKLLSVWALIWRTQFFMVYLFTRWLKCKYFEETSHDAFYVKHRNWLAV